MFGKNEIVGQRYFAEAPERSLLLTSRFMTLQGEGPFRGHPAFFLRLTKCNLNCSFCDTYFDAGEYFTFEEIDSEITDSIEAHFCGNVPEYAKNRRMVLVLTGGEPSLQKNIVPFLHEVGSTFQHTQIESNGIILQNIPESTFLVISPKCVKNKYLKPLSEVLDRANCLKFVVSSDRDSAYSNIPDWAHAWADKTRREVYVSPMNEYLRFPKQADMNRKRNSMLKERSDIDERISFWEEGLLDREKNQKNHEYAAALCLEHGYTLNLQQHLYASLP